MTLRRAIALACCLLGVSAVPVLAADPITAGIEAGANFTDVTLGGADATNLSSGFKPGLYIGGFAEIPLNKIIAIQPEVAYSQKHFSVNDTVGSFTTDEHWDWIEVPVLARFNFSEMAAHHFYAVVGPGFSFRVRAQEQANGTSNDVKNDVKSTEVSAIIGAGYTMGKLSIQGTYDGGVTDLNNNYGLGDLLTVKSRTIRIVAMWSFK